MVSDLPAARRVRRPPRFTSTTRCRARRTAAEAFTGIEGIELESGTEHLEQAVAAFAVSILTAPAFAAALAAVSGNA